MREFSNHLILPGTKTMVNQAEQGIGFSNHLILPGTKTSASQP